MNDAMLTDVMTRNNRILGSPSIRFGYIYLTCFRLGELPLMWLHKTTLWIKYKPKGLWNNVTATIISYFLSL